MIKLEIELDDINYEKMVEQLMPMIGGSMKESRGFLGKILSGKASSTVAKGVLSKMSQKKKEEYVEKLINKNDKKIMSLLEEKAAYSGFDITVNKLRAKARPKSK